MKKRQLSNWLLVGATGAALFACQSKNNIPPPAPPQAPSEDEVPCREDECDEEEAGEEAMAEDQYDEQETSKEAMSREDKHETQEAGEEAMIHVIEMDEPNEEKQEAAIEEAPSQEAVQMDAPVESAEPKLESQETSGSAELNVETPSLTEEPTTKMFEDFPSSPISENTVVLSLEE